MEPSRLVSFGGSALDQGVALVFDALFGGAGEHLDARDHFCDLNDGGDGRLGDIMNSVGSRAGDISEGFAGFPSGLGAARFWQ